jgi:hypothetical protein
MAGTAMASTTPFSMRKQSDQPCQDTREIDMREFDSPEPDPETWPAEDARASTIPGSGKAARVPSILSTFNLSQARNTIS